MAPVSDGFTKMPDCRSCARAMPRRARVARRSGLWSIANAATWATLSGTPEVTPGIVAPDGASGIVRTSGSGE